MNKEILLVQLVFVFYFLYLVIADLMIERISLPLMLIRLVF